MRRLNGNRRRREFTLRVSGHDYSNDQPPRGAHDNSEIAARQSWQLAIRKSFSCFVGGAIPTDYVLDREMSNARYDSI